MALIPLKLPRLQANLAIVDGAGKPLPYFLRLLNIDVFQAIERNEAAQQQTIQDLTEIVTAVQAAQEAAQIAQQTANEGAGGNSTTGTVSPAIGVWLTAAVVNFPAAVASETLTISGTGPVQAADVVKDEPGNAPGQFRVVEVVGGVDTILITGDYNVYASGEAAAPPLVTNMSASAIAAYSSVRSSSGSVDYRVDVRQTSGTPVSNMSVYLNARRV